MKPKILTYLLRCGLMLGAVSILGHPESALALPDIKIAGYDATTKVITLDGDAFDPSTSKLYIDGDLVAIQTIWGTGLRTVAKPLTDGTHELLLVDASGEDIHMLAITKPGSIGPQGPQGQIGRAHV